MADQIHPVGTHIGDETYAAQAAAGAAFLANLPPGYIDLPLEQQKTLTTALAKLIAEKAGQIVAAHVLVWEPVYADPTSGDGLDRPMPAVCQQFNPATEEHVALWLKIGTQPKQWWNVGGSTDDHLVKARVADATAVGGVLEKTADSQTIKRTLVTEDGVEKVQFNAVAVQPEKVRYYLSDTHGTPGGDPEYTGHLLLEANPYEEASAIDLSDADAREWLVFVSGPTSPNTETWQSGTLHAHLRLKLTGARVGRTYKLYTGNGDIVYTDMVWDWTHSNPYQVRELAPAQPTVTESYADFDLDMPVSALSSGSDGRFGLNLRLRVFVGSTEDTFDGELLIVRVGGTNASYIDTLFTPGGDAAPAMLHNDLKGREKSGAHPAAAVMPSISSFQGRLSNADTDVQKALETLSKRESARYYLVGSYADPVLSRFPSATTWNSGAISITTGSTMLLQASSAGWDPGLVAIDRGNCLLKVNCSATVAAKLHLVVKVGSTTVAVSPWIPVAASGPTVLFAEAVDPALFVSALDDNVTVELLAAAISGSGTITLFSGGVNLATLVCPWQAEVDRHFDVPFSIPVALSNGLIPRALITRDLVFPVDLEGSLARIFTASTNNRTVDIKLDGSTTVATAALTAGSATVSLASDGFYASAGSWLSVEPPTADITAANFSITLKGAWL